MSLSRGKRHLEGGRLLVVLYGVDQLAAGVLPGEGVAVLVEHLLEDTAHLAVERETWLVHHPEGEQLAAQGHLG